MLINCSVLCRRIFWVFTCLLLVSVASRADDCVPVGEVLLLDMGQKSNVAKLIKSQSKQRIVLLGEHHDNMEHHRWQLQMMTGLHSLNENIVLGFEMFPRQAQPVLDKWVAGELTEKEFLKQANWSEYWSFDEQLYMPMFHFARMNQIPVYALNVDRNLIREVGRKGWKDIDSALKEGLSDPAPSSEGYRQMLASVFMQHGQDHGGGKDDPEALVEKAMAMPAFSRFVESQQVWDRAMAESIAGAVKMHPKAQMIAVLGSGHMMYRFGVPEQLDDLDMPNASVLIPWDPEFECDYIQKDFANAVIGLKAIRLSEQEENGERPKLGVYLDSAEQGVKIVNIVPKSIAEKLALRQDDLIIRLAGYEISEVEQVIDIVRNTQFGTWLPISIRRGDEVLEMIAKFPPRQSKEAN